MLDIDIKDRSSYKNDAKDYVSREYLLNSYDSLIEEYRKVGGMEDIVKHLVFLRFMVSNAPSIDTRKLYHDMLDMEGYQE